MKRIVAKRLSKEIGYISNLFLWNDMTEKFLVHCFVSNENKYFTIIKEDVENEKFEDISEDEIETIILSFMKDFNIHYSIEQIGNGKYFCSYRTKKNYSMMLAHGKRYSSSLIFHDDTYINALIYLYMNILLYFTDDLLEEK